MQKIINTLHLSLNFFLLLEILYKTITEQDFSNFIYSSQKNVYEQEIIYLRILQLFQISDFVFSKGGFINVFLQLLSRNLLAQFMMSSQCSPLPLFLVMVPWTIADVSRYAFYIFKNIKIISILRYNLFIILYPVGGIHEFILLQELGQKYPQEISYTIYQWSIYHKYALFIGFAILYTHMFASRKKFYKKLQQEKKEIKTE